MKRLGLLVVSGMTLLGLGGAANAQGWRGGGGHGHGAMAAPARGFHGAPAPARGFQGAPRPYSGPFVGHAAPVYARPLAPSRAHVWVPGYWGVRGGARAWIGGAWLVPPTPGWIWVAPQWTWNGYTWVWMEGHWAAAGY